jgi:hypothetical protein
LFGGVVAIKKSTGAQHIAFGMTVSLFQDVFLSRNMESSPSVATWSTLGFANTTTEKGIASYIRGLVKDKTDQFINAYLSVNPKGVK